MPIKPNAKTLKIKEQIIDDPASGLKFQFEVIEGSNEPFRMNVFGDLPYGNRKIFFNADGKEGGGETYLGQEPCAASWLKEVK